jgi:hypothetical protein
MVERARKTLFSSSDEKEGEKEIRNGETRNLPLFSLLSSRFSHLFASTRT